MTVTHSDRLMAVVVLYKQDVAQVGSWPTLLDWLSQVKSTGFKLERVLIYDNSPEPISPEKLAFIAGCSYWHDGNNGGTGAAFERAATVANELGINWLLLLDQDTVLPSGLLEAAAGSCSMESADPPGALVPWVSHDGKIVSPVRITPTGFIRPLAPGAMKGGADVISAVASGSILHVSTLRAILPMPELLWLDFVDHWIYWRMALLGRRIVVVEAVLQHRLSVETPAMLSRNRMFSILDGERFFVTQLGIMARVIYPLRLLGRLAQYVMISPRAAGHLLEWLSMRMRHSTR
jgi:GT2 family glycosyltransferase